MEQVLVGYLEVEQDKVMSSLCMTILKIAS